MIIVGSKHSSKLLGASCIWWAIRPIIRHTIDKPKRYP